MLRWLIVVCPVLYVASCALTTELKGREFDKVKIGDTRTSVINLLGNPSVHEKQETLYALYATNKCKNPCVERLWFENRFLIGIEAWSIELVNDGRVVGKSHWMLP